MNASSVPRGTTQVYGIAGNPVSHSLSPLIHNASFRHIGKDAIYVPFPIPKATASLARSLGACGIQGLSVTIPHKTWALKSADRADDLSRLCRAANTLLFHPDGSIEARNTDGPGALRGLKTVVPRMGGKRTLILGYGGSAAAIAYSLVLFENPSLVAIHGRNKKRRDHFAAGLAEQMEKQGATGAVRSTDLTDLKPEDIDLIINTTPVGMKGGPEGLPLPEDFIQKYHIVYDIVYVPARTPLLTLAEKKGARTVPGYLMLLYQAVLQFELFTGQKAPVHLMESLLLKELRKR